MVSTEPVAEAWIAKLTPCEAETMLSNGCPFKCGRTIKAPKRARPVPRDLQIRQLQKSIHQDSSL